MAALGTGWMDGVGRRSQARMVSWRTPLRRDATAIE